MKRHEYITIDHLINAMAILATESAIYKKLAIYFEQEYMKIVFMTAEEVAKNAGVSQGSVSRFCMALGFKGYSDFYKFLQRMITEELTAPQRYMYTKSADTINDEILDKESANLHEITQIMTEEAYRELVHKMAKAERVILLSARMSATLLPYMKYLLDKLRDQVEIVVPESSEWNRLFLHDKEKVLIVTTCFPRYARVLIEKIQELNREGYDIYALTDRRMSPIVQEGIPALLIPITTTSIFDIYSTPIAFINLLCKDVAKEIPDLDKRLERIEDYDISHQTFYK